MELRRVALAGALSSLIMLAAVPVVPAASPALLAPSLSRTPTPVPVPTGPRVYKLPYGGGQRFEVCQGNNHAGGTHTGMAAYAWDFCMPVGTPVTAARGGAVRSVRQGSNTGGWGFKYADDANYVVLDHGDGTSSLYMHLMFNGSRVKVGDQVQTGQLLAYSGNTGWTSAPHLHFMVMQTLADNNYSQSQPVLFLDVASNGGLPLEDSSYTSGNAPVDARLMTPATAAGPPPFTPFWVETFRGSTLWSGPDDKAIQFGPASPWQYFQVTAPQTGARLQVTVAATGAPAFVPAADVGPSGPPPAALFTPAGPAAGSSAPLPSTPSTPASRVTAAPPTSGASAPAPAAAPRGDEVVVGAGDTLYAIAKAHHSSIDRIAGLNGLKDPSDLNVGQVLKVA